MAHATPLKAAAMQKIHAGSYARPHGRTSLTIGSLNIRFSNDAVSDWKRPPLDRPDGNPFSPTMQEISSSASPHLMAQHHGERHWFLRGPKISDIALFHAWDIFAFQEVLHPQLSNLVNWLGDEYSYAGVGRDDGAYAGEAVPVFWRRDTFELVPHAEGGAGADGVEHFWLSPTPEIPGSVGWDAALTRMCTHVSLRLLATGEIIHVFSTHYDHQGVVARAKSSELIVDRARRAAKHTKSMLREQPLVVLIGDLNSPRNEGSWSTLVSPHYGLQANSTGPTFLDTALSVPTRFTSPLLTDNEDPKRAEYAAGKRIPPPPPAGRKEAGMLFEPVGPMRTFTDFQPSKRNAIDDRIDFIMLLDNGAVLDETRGDARLDHSKSSPPPAIRSEGDSDTASRQSGKVEERESRWRIRTFGTLPNWSEGDAGFLISDHRPVMARIQRDFTLS
uniref:Endonuclease/exonuclease/phosphatase domain-containing protein n=2 Tax=Kalmanozyma brasiliensis (strain GHG001) TaxID=1365824 RepID=V5GKY6_KALBG